MSSLCFAAIRLQQSLERSLVLYIMKCPLCGTLVMTQLFIGHQLGLNQLIIISTKWQDCFLITDRFQLMSWLSMWFPFLHVFGTFSLHLFLLLHIDGLISLDISHNCCIYFMHTHLVQNVFKDRLFDFEFTLSQFQGCSAPKKPLLYNEKPG